MRAAHVTSLLVIALLAAPAVARAQMTDWRTAGSLSYDARYARYDADAPIDDLPAAVDLGVSLRAIASKRLPLGFGAGFDLHLGAGLAGGFAYDVTLSPFGVGLRLGKWGMVGALVGVGVSGVSERIPFAVQLPLEVFADFGLSKYVRVHAWGVRRLIEVADDRPDERGAGLQLRLNRSYEQWGFASGNGYYVGVTYDERLGSEAIGVMVGYSLHFATAR